MNHGPHTRWENTAPTRAQRAGRRRRALTDVESALAIIEGMQRDPYDRVLACAARCLQCQGTPGGVRDCTDQSCALYRLRPFQLAQFRGAPHLELPVPTADLERRMRGDDCSEGEP